MGRSDLSALCNEVEILVDLSVSLAVDADNFDSRRDTSINVKHRVIAAL